ncbi:AAA family ATPase [Bifidobacterium moukalabense]|uniref:AAA family ATPase n=1 Tax=Bifidobacterium moukalabense TaxID=1333651 RepID=UPI0010F8B8DD|nr:AAA family ATPase [Bifidobacterium moukalabense]
MNSLTQKNGKTKQTDYVLTPMLDELVRNVEFLGGNVWFPSGAITILGGRKRCGKSTLALYECAKFSAMGKKVLIVQREDDAGLVKAKLQCMGAALGNIMLYKRYDHETEYCGFDARDLQGIVESAGRMHADLVYIDPLHGLAAGRMNDQQSADCLIALDAMAKRNNCCVLGVLHAKKDPEDVSYAISGSDQWVAKARSYLYLETCPNASDVAVCQQVDASYSDTINAKIRFGIRGCVGDDGKTFPVRVVVETAPTDDTAQDYLDLKNVMKEDRTDPVVREAMAEWMHDAVHLNGNHMLTRELFHQAESKDRRWTPAKLRKAFSLAGLGQARAAERGSRSIVYLKDPSEYSGEEAERLGRGSTPETLAKEWVATVPR